MLEPRIRILLDANSKPHTNGTRVISYEAFEKLLLEISRTKRNYISGLLKSDDTTPHYDSIYKDNLL